MKEITIYNTLKGRLETVRFEFTPENTTWFDDSETFDIYRIADGFDGLLIQETGYTYPGQTSAMLNKKPRSCYENNID